MSQKRLSDIVCYYASRVSADYENTKTYEQKYDEDFRGLESLTVNEVFEKYGRKYNDNEFYDDVIKYADIQKDLFFIINVLCELHKTKININLKAFKNCCIAYSQLRDLKLYGCHDFYDLMRDYYKMNQNSLIIFKNSFIDLLIEEEYKGREIKTTNEELIYYRLKTRENPFLDDLVYWYKHNASNPKHCLISIYKRHASNLCGYFKGDIKELIENPKELKDLLPEIIEVIKQKKTEIKHEKYLIEITYEAQ